MTGDKSSKPKDQMLEMYRLTAHPGRVAAAVTETISPVDAGESGQVQLPDPDMGAGPGLWDALRRRRSVREYRDQPMALEALSQILWAACGTVGRQSTGRLLRTAPSAGARYPIEIYPIANRVLNLRNGLYHYQHSVHRLAPLAYGDLGTAISAAALGQDSCRQAPVVIALTALFERTAERYHERAWRYVFLDAGHVAENVALAAAGLGMGTCMIGSFHDDQTNELVRADGEREVVIYMITVGHPTS